MPDPFSTTGRAPRHDLPLLFAGQAQKEFFVNEALARIDALIAPTVEGFADTPPADPQDGEAWLVGPDATGAWGSNADRLACFSGGDWLLCAPREGMRVWDNAAGRLLLYRDGWHGADLPTIPAGGPVVDAEARAALLQLVTALQSAGIFSR